MKRAKSLRRWLKQTGLHAADRYSYTEPQFEPHTKAIGSLLLAWNDLHERLSTLFVMTMGIGQYERSFAVWHATRTDLNKRRLLRAAIANLPSAEFEGKPKLIEEITWILDVADKLEGLRDDSAHTPLHVGFSDLLTLTDLYENTSILGDGTVAPQIGFANPRALRVHKSNQDLRIERRYARERILVLRDYALAIDYAWANNPRWPWPERPELPERRPNRRSKAEVSRQKKK